MTEYYKLYIDSREHKRIPYAKARCMSWGWDYEIKQLRYGDYVCGNTVIEWKTTMDFISSVIDGRMKKEAIDQANHFPFHYVIIVGDVDTSCAMYKKYTKRQFHKTSFYSAVASLMLYTNVIIVPNLKDGFHLLRYLIEKSNKTGSRVVRPVEKLSRNPCYNFLVGIPRISQKRAENICTLHNLKTLPDLMKMDKKKLLAVDGIGESLADEILRALGKEVK